MTVQRLLLRFSYYEHDWDYTSIDGPEAIAAELMRRAADGQWQDVEDVIEPEEVSTVDELAERAEEVFVGEWEMPTAVAQLPIDKLRAIIAEGGWAFAAGEFTEFEGHHNDTEMIVKLVRA